MTDAKIRFLPPRNVRSRIAVVGLALIMALPLLVWPELWQCLLAAIMLLDVLLRHNWAKQRKVNAESILDRHKEGST